MNKSVITLISLAWVLAACHHEPEEIAAPRPVWVLTVGDTMASTAASYTGEVKSRYESPLAFRIGGKIIARSVNVGDVVSKGQLIAKLDASDSQLNAQAAQADVLAAKANLKLAEAELERRQQLLQKQFISRSALDSYETQVRTAQAKLQQAEAQAAVSARQTGYTQLLADRVGVVGMIAAEPGQVVSSGQVIARIYDLNALEVVIAVPENLITRLHPGEAATVTLAEQQYAGRIREIAPAANSQTHAFDVRVQVLDADQAMKLGMTASVQFSSLSANSDKPLSVLVPTTAVTQHRGQPAVWVIDDKQQAHLRTVTTGMLSEAGIPVLSGLQAGERVATMGVHTLVEGMQVQAIIPGSKELN
jgi:membrane fusion protein, multidrug efflux system